MTVTRTSVVATAGAAALIDLATLKDDLGVADTSTDNFLTRAITRVSALIATYCGQPFEVDQVEDTFVVPADPYPFETVSQPETLELARWPVSAIASVTEAGIVLDPSLYDLDGDTGTLTRLGADGDPALWAPGDTVISYTAGQQPPDVVDCAVKLVAARYYGRGRDPLLKSESLPGVGSSSWSGAATDAPDLPADVAMVLDRYRMPVCA